MDLFLILTTSEYKQSSYKPGDHCNKLNNLLYFILAMSTRANCCQCRQFQLIACIGQGVDKDSILLCYC
jgi:hypothetical protein